MRSILGDLLGEGDADDFDSDEYYGKRGRDEKKK